MRPFNRWLVLLAAGAAIVWARPAGADERALTFSFSDLVSDFSESSLLFTASDRTQTTGDLTRLDPFGVAVFDGASTSGFFSLDMTISVEPGLDPANFLTGEGVLTITDIDGDTISSNAVAGLWINSGSALFAGRLQDLAITSSDGAFNGSSGTVSLNGLIGPLDDDPFNIFTMTFGNWFTDGGGGFTGFSGASTLTQGTIIPEPVTLCLLALGTLVMAGRWRRKT